MTTRALKKAGERGNALVEMALVFLPLMFLLCSTVELARGLWVYHTLVMTVTNATRYASVHGASCAAASADCPVTLAQLITLIEQTGVGIDPANLDLTFTANGTSVSCAPVSSCAANSTSWPASPDNGVGRTISVSATYQLHSVLAQWWPGQSAGIITLSAKGAETIQ